MQLMAENEPINSELLTVQEIASRLKVKESWVYTHAEQLGAYHLGKYLRFSWDCVIKGIKTDSQSLGPKPNDPLQAIDNNSLENSREQFGNRMVKFSL